MKNKAVDENSGHVSKLVHQFYFVKRWPTVPDSVSQIKKQEKVNKTLNQDISEIIDKITKKTLEKEYLDFNMALDELNFRNVKVENGGWFGEKLDKNSLNYLRFHGSKSLGEEKKIMRDIKIQQKDVSPFKSLEVLKQTLLCRGESLFFIMDQFQIQHKERASKYDSLKKNIEDHIKLLCDGDSFKNRRVWMEFGVRNKHNIVKEQVAINGELHSLKEKLAEKYKKREEAFQMRLKLRSSYYENIPYYNHCSFMNKVYQLAEEKNVAALDEMSSLEVEKFMLEWNNNKAFRDDYEKKLPQSLERRQLDSDGRRRPEKSCSSMLL